MEESGGHEPPSNSNVPVAAMEPARAYAPDLSACVWYTAGSVVVAIKRGPSVSPGTSHLSKWRHSGHRRTSFIFLPA